MSEPLVWKTIKTEGLYMIVYLFKDEEEIKRRRASLQEDDPNLLDDTLDGFLSTSLNTELVYVIL